MISASPVRNILKGADKVTSTHLVIAEWNMNRYQKVADYGIYQGNPSDELYESKDGNIKDGKNFYIYDDNSTKETEYAEYFSSIASIFEPFRPDPGIVLLQKIPNGIITDIGNMKGAKINSASPRFYPFSKNRKYDYFNSGKPTNNAPTSDTDLAPGWSNPRTGDIQNANPFIVYSSSFVCNKIVVKVQNHLSLPKIWSVQILNTSDNWVTVYSSNSSTEWEDGILNLYYDGDSTWTRTVTRADNLDEITTPTTQLKAIRGIRFCVERMETYSFTYTDDKNKGKTKTRKYAVPLEVIELSPRIEYDLTSYTESFSINTSLADSDLGLPVGGLVASNGDITLSNETKEFLLSSTAAKYKMLTPDVEFKFYQKFTINSTDYTIPLGVMYSNSWNVGNDFTAQISLSDKFKFFQETNVPDMLLVTNNGIPFSVIIQILLDNCGITGYEFKKSSNFNAADVEDTIIKNFWCNKEQTLADVLDELSKGTQSAMYFDAVGNLNVITKERITRPVQKDEAFSQTTSGSTDFWMVFDEQFSGQQELSYLLSSTGSYTANVISSTDSIIDPITDGNIKYHSYGVKKSRGGSLLSDYIPQQLLEDIPANSLISSNFVYESRLVWQPANSGMEGVLSAANLMSTIRDKHIYDKNVFEDIVFYAENEQEALKAIYASATSSEPLLKTVSIMLDRNDAFLFQDYSGYVMIDNEFIEYDGIIYAVNGKDTILFSAEEVNEKINSLSLRNAIIPKGLLIKMRLSVVDIKDNTYGYKVVGDGRAQFNSTIAAHERYVEEPNNDFIKQRNKFHAIIGESSNKSKFKEYPNTSLYYDFTENIKKFKSIRRKLNMPPSQFKTYLGYLRMSGPKSKEDRFLLSLTSSANTASPSYVQDQLNSATKDVKDLVPGTGFDQYVYVDSERYLYGQMKEIDFNPNVIGARMRLYTGRREIKQDSYIASTFSSIAGIGFAGKFTYNESTGIRYLKQGYFLEIESIGSNAKDTDKGIESLKKNLRFYKLYRNSKGELIPKVLATAPVNMMTSISADAYLINDSQVSSDPVCDIMIEVNVEKKGKKKQATFEIFYGGQSITASSGSASDPIIDKLDDGEQFWTDNNKNIFMFVRNDSQAIYENIYAIKKMKVEKDFLSKMQDKELSKVKQYGGQSIVMQGLFKNSDRFKIFFEDFGKTVRQTKKYTPRFEAPIVKGKLIDISRVNPQYMVMKQDIGPFGAELVVVNMSNTALALSGDNNLPLYIQGFQLEEISSGEVTLTDFYNKIDEDGKKATDLAFNKSVYGNKSFTLDNKYITTSDHAKKMISWIIQNCSRQRLTMSMEIFPNPLLEVGDKVKVFSKDRGYYENNSNFGKKTFVIKDISRSISNQGPSMNITIVEVGAK